MTIKDYGYYGYAYLGSRVITAVALLPVIGMVSNFINEIAKTEHDAPGELTATLVFTVLAFLWVLLSMTGYDDTHIPYLVTAGIDFVFLIPYITISVLLGQPLAMTTCSALPQDANAVLLPMPDGRSVSYITFSGAGQTICYELMAVWGLTITLCILFATSSVAAGFLWLGKRRATAASSEAELGLKASSSGAPSFVDPPEFIPAPPPFQHSSTPTVGSRGPVEKEYLSPVMEEDPLGISH